ncbi:RAD9, HUS1, RAD1-interacting nuclear orphan protein 1 [Alosa alosa]|uniref:RAD9, HUS1, RAD1-interacting nuclear orphan protein 1 n=1 Tax=Alosa alosa TaxID=278164 RepID=UPI0020154254|nr:RAD9, HUS1, RAD1-interacting nuclear orphan protein 1 [Alosa alosa]
MPRNTRRKRLLNPNQTQLSFVETPINGDIHRYGLQPRSAINPKTLISEERRENGKAWVSPQFDQIRLPEVMKKRTRGSQSQSVSNTRYNSTCTNIRKTNKYPSLSFANHAAEGLHIKTKELRKETENSIVPRTSQMYVPGPSNARAEVDLATPRRTRSFQRRSVESTLSSNRTHEGSAENRKVSSPPVSHMSSGMPNYTGSSEVCTSVGFRSPNVGNYFIPPDIDTPEVPQKVTSSSKCTLLHLLWPSTPPHPHDSDILVKDTPERDYGLKVTWRKRKELMRLLIKRGQLTNQQVEVTAS